MNILCSGACGFVGSHTVDALVEAGHSVVVFDPTRQNENPKAQYIKASLGTLGILLRHEIEKADAIYHFAARVNSLLSLGAARMDMVYNLDPGLNLLECCRQVGWKGKIIYSSSCAVYGNAGQEVMTEQSPIAPLSPYGMNKYVVELYLKMYAKLYGIDYTILRYSNVYGPRQVTGEGVGVIPIFIQAMLKGEPVTINGTGEQTRDFIYVSDVVDANVQALTRGSKQTFNIGSGIPTSILEVFRCLKTITNYPNVPCYRELPVAEADSMTLDNSWAWHELYPWRPQVKLLEGLNKTVDWWKERMK